MRGRLAAADKDAARAAEKAVKTQSELAAMLNKETGAILLKNKNALARAVDEAEQIAEKTRRKALKLGAKVALLESEAIDQGLLTIEVAPETPDAAPGEPEPTIEEPRED